jgi:bifunctional DNA-binding transcriptional regulator/antitoxin component of YhaV-PrlF toxin-antitoxin module
VIPSEHARPSPPAPSLPLHALPRVPPDAGLLLGVAAVSHSGRVRDRVLIYALGWQPGNRLRLDITDTAIVIRRAPDGRFSLNDRAQIFLPAGARAHFGIADNQRVALLADPTHGLLLVYTCAVVTAVLAGLNDSFLGGPDVH